MLNFKDVLHACASISLAAATHAAEISGTALTAETVKGSAGVIVTVTSANRTIGETTTRADGTYTIVVDAPGRYEISYKKVAHHIIVPKDSVLIADKNVTTKLIRVFSNKEALSANTLGRVLRERAAEQELSLKEDLLVLKQFGSLDPQLIASVERNVGKASEFPDISIAELKAAIAEKRVTVLDVNGKDSYAAGRIPGAIDFTAEMEQLASKLPADKNALVIAYWGEPTIGAFAAAAKAAKAAKELGYTNVKHLSAGISDWKKAGGEVVEMPK